MKKINESFICNNCGKFVNIASKTCRNHCPYCFVSLHIDYEIPGDRLSTCNGKMYPVEYEIKNGQTKIHFKCIICNKSHRNITANDDDFSMLDHFIDIYKFIFNITKSGN